MPGWPPQSVSCAAHDNSCLPLRPEPQRRPASGPRLFGAPELRHGPRGRRPFPPAHRGYRYHPLHAGVGRTDLPRLGLAGARMGDPRAPPVGAFRRLCRGAGAPCRGGDRLPFLHEPGRSTRLYRRCGGGRCALAARSRRSAALPARRQGAAGVRAAAAHGGGRALRLAARHGGSHGALGPAAFLGRERQRARRRDGQRAGAAGGLGRRGDRPQGDAGELSSVGGGGRCIARHHPRGARARPLSRDGGSSAAAGVAWPAGAILSPSRAHPRRGRAQALQESR